MQKFLLQADDLDVLIQVIAREGHRLIGPTLRDGAIVYDDIHSVSDLPRDWTDDQEKGRYRLRKRGDGAYFGYAAGPHSWKQFLQLPRRPVWRAERDANGVQIIAIEEMAPRLAFMGVRSCELHAIAIQDRVFLEGPFRNDDYDKRRQPLLLIAVNCTAPAATCFCTSMNTGPEVTLPADLTMTEVMDGDAHYFLIDAGTGRGEHILKQLPLTPAQARQQALAQKSIQHAAEQMEQGPRSFDSSDVKDLLYRNYESPEWELVADRCLSCANCTMACPTCFCSTVEDTTDLTGENAERWERWDSCFTADFSYITGGAVRADTRSRYRQWMTHKLATWHDQFDSSGCVGCGRCIAWCPVGIDLTEELLRIREMENQ
ncbi:4Fe-4S dicluster domain-containing protein [Microbulbifer harenosus]|uniref:Sulfite reductase subunit A n=1 Tax=Microbulbifer harenosus TaxID=2576840 RepID=A0ABY2UG95_9GAMM|nr:MULTISPECIES: 4Fe-4S dicluster domain-containing protein [Microbulbifer]QIL89212.1 sulfite reductase subunit A [Microbulbifer sp. SH-1]TLM76441.1 sulfite reductase subunit A [Microbulbifer harenosus]